MYRHASIVGYCSVYFDPNLLDMISCELQKKQINEYCSNLGTPIRKIYSDLEEATNSLDEGEQFIITSILCLGDNISKILGITNLIKKKSCSLYISDFGSVLDSRESRFRFHIYISMCLLKYDLWKEEMGYNINEKPSCRKIN